MFGLFNPFKKHLPPIYKKEGGYRPWDDRQPPKRMSWKPLVLGCGLMLFLCAGLPGAAAMFFLRSTGGGEVTPTLDLTHIIEEYIDNRTQTPDMTEVIQELASVHTETPMGITATVTASPEFIATPESHVTIQSFTYNVQPTYTPYPTYTNQAPRIVTVRESSGSNVVVRTQIVERDVLITELAPVYVVVTATPQAIPTTVPTAAGFWTAEPDYFPTREPIWGMTTTGSN